MLRNSTWLTVERSFGNMYARNVIIFGADNNSSSHADSLKNNFLVLMEVLVHQKKSLVLILVKQTQIFPWVYLIMLIIVICLLMEKKSLSLKLSIKMLTFQLNFIFKIYITDLVILSLEKYFKWRCVWTFTRLQFYW